MKYFYFSKAFATPLVEVKEEHLNIYLDEDQITTLQTENIVIHGDIVFILVKRVDFAT